MVTIGQFFGVLRRRWLSLALAVAVAVLAAGALYHRAAPSYQATAVVDITPSAGSGIDPKTVSTATQQNVVTSTEVAARAAKILGTGTPDTLAKHVSVISPLNSLVLNIQFTASTARRAAAGANAFANGYISYRKEVGQAQLDQLGRSVEARLTPLEKSLNALPKSSDQRAAVQAQIASLQQQLNELASSAVSAGQLIGPASPPAAANSPRVVIYGAAGVLFGLIVGVAIAVVRDRRDDRVRSAADLEIAVGGRVLGVVPEPRQPRRRRPVLSTVNDLHGREADAFRSLALKLVSSDDTDVTQSIALVGGDRAEMVPVNLAVVLARQGLRTALVGSTTAIGHAGTLLDVPVKDIAGVHAKPVAVDGVEGLQLLPLGDEVALDRSPRSVAGKLARLADAVDVFVVDGMNVAHRSSALGLSRRSETAVLVARAGVTEQRALRELERELSQIGVRVAGAILLTKDRSIDRWRRGRPVAVAEHDTGHAPSNAAGAAAAKSGAVKSVAKAEAADEPVTRRNEAGGVSAPVAGAFSGQPA